MRVSLRLLWVAALMAAWCGPGAAQSVQFAGSMGAKALLVVDGQAHTLAVGETRAGVKLVSVADGVAQVERQGQASTLRLGAAPVALGGAARPSGAREIVVTAGAGGHFFVPGSINGRAVQFMVDTGATSVAIGQAEAERLGLDWRNGQRALSSTANGPVPVQLLTLSSVRVGEVQVANVSAIVMPAPMPYILLGNSFLTRFQMRRENDVMRLELRP